MMKLKALSLKGTAKKRKTAHLVIAVLAVGAALGFIARWFPGEIAKVTGIESGMVSIWADTIFGTCLGLLVAYLGLLFVTTPIVTIALFIAGGATIYFSLNKVL